MFVHNQRLPGQFFDKETNLHYNYFRDYWPDGGRYVQSDPIGLAGGVNTYLYVLGSPLQYSDRVGLFSGGVHHRVTYEELVIAGVSPNVADLLAVEAVRADYRPSFSVSQSEREAHRHGMARRGEDPAEAFKNVQRYIDNQVRLCTPEGFANAAHAAQDTAAGGHDYREYTGSVGFMHIFRDFFPLRSEMARARARTRDVIRKYNQFCGCLPGGAATRAQPSIPAVNYIAP